ncbi:MAG: SDR family NAD(P)-dependent oxidoreductase [Oceanococcus sp.]
MKYPVKGKRILITGASSGIGRAAALQLAAEGAELILVARRLDELQALQSEIEQLGGTAFVYGVDLNDFDAIDTLAATVLETFGGVDVLVNNAGRSIRRPIVESLDRFHDFERCMRLNYFAVVRLTLKLLPSMLKQGDGHVINVLTWGTLLPSPRFAAYVGSKQALHGFSDALAAELPDEGIAVTTVHYPIVRTPMIAPTKQYNKLPGMSAEQAGAWIVKAVKKRPARLAPGFALLASLNSFVFPKLAQRLAGKLPV